MKVWEGSLFSLLKIPSQQAEFPGIRPRERGCFPCSQGQACELVCVCLSRAFTLRLEWAIQEAAALSAALNKLAFHEREQLTSTKNNKKRQPFAQTNHQIHSELSIYTADGNLDFYLFY